MKCVVCKKTWDEAGLISGKVDLSTADTPRGFGLDNQPICAACIAGMSSVMADNAAEAVREIQKAKGRK